MIHELEMPLQPEVRRDALPADAGDARDFERRPALIDSDARAAARWVERLDRLVLVRILHAELVDPAATTTRRSGRRTSAQSVRSCTVPRLRATMPPKSSTPSRFDVGVVAASDEAVERRPMVIDLAQELVVRDCQRHVAELHREARAWSARDAAVWIDGHDAVVGDVGAARATGRRTSGPCAGDRQAWRPTASGCTGASRRSTGLPKMSNCSK